MPATQNPTPDSTPANVSQPVAIDRLPSPYRSEADIVTQALVSLEAVSYTHLTLPTSDLV